MLNVSSKHLHIIFLSTAILVSGCKDPDVSVGSLGKKLPAPVLTGPSPFSQNFDLQGYARLQGICDSRIGNVFISFDQTTWPVTPASPDIGTSTLPAGTTNDINCADGVFDIYVTENDLLNIWNISPANHPASLFIKGETAIGDSEILTIKNTSTGGGSNSGPGPAAKIGLEKTWPRGFAGTLQCESFRVNLLDSNGHRGAVSTVPVSFQIQRPTTGNIDAYTSWSDCSTSLGALNTFTIPAGTDGMTVYYRFPAGPIDTSINFSLITASLTVDPAPTAVMLRDNYSSMYRYLLIESPLHQIYKDVCYPITVRSYKYYKMLANDSMGGAVDFISNDSGIKFYTGADCSTQTGSYTFAAMSSELNVYLKYSSTGSEGVPFKNVNFTMSAAPGNNYVYDALPIETRIDLTSSNIANKLDLWGARDTTMNHCEPYWLVSLNNNGSLHPVSGPTTVTLNSSGGQYYLDYNSCFNSISPVTSAPMQPGMSFRLLYFKASSGGLLSLTPFAPGMTSPIKEINAL